ncbi:metal-dependent hydrolase [Nanoarchaeota archaeon]
MLSRTHLAITIFFILLFISYVENKVAFVIAALIATLLPDVDSRYSLLGRKKPFRILQFFTRHRHVIHSFTFLILITLILLWFFPIIALGFFLGYGIHLLADSFTIDGITPFYPWKEKASGKVRTGSRKEISIFVLFVIFDVILLGMKVLNI